MAKTARCAAHKGLAANALCGACNRGLCNDCFRFRLGGRAACAACAFEASTRPARRLSLGASFLCFATVAGFFIDRRQDLLAHDRRWLFFGAMLVLLVAVAVARSGRGVIAEVERREPEEDQIGELDLTGSNQPYRAHVRRAILAASPWASLRGLPMPSIIIIERSRWGGLQGGTRRTGVTPHGASYTRHRSRARRGQGGLRSSSLRPRAARRALVLHRGRPRC